MTVIALDNDPVLNRDVSYPARWLSETLEGEPDPNDGRIKVFYGEPGDRSFVIREMDVNVTTPWNPRYSHDPYDFTA